MSDTEKPLSFVERFKKVGELVPPGCGCEVDRYDNTLDERDCRYAALKASHTELMDALNRLGYHSGNDGSQYCTSADCEDCASCAQAVEALKKAEALK